jgi:hypothetical protein
MTASAAGIVLRIHFQTIQYQALHAYRMTRYIPEKWIEQLMRCEHLPESDMKVLCDRVRTILMEESNIQPVSSPVTICGDIHGQFWDLLELLRKGGSVPETSYIFMARAWHALNVSPL